MQLYDGGYCVGGIAHLTCARAGTGVGYRIPTTKVEMAESFMASAEDLYNALTTQEVCMYVCVCAYVCMYVCIM